MEYTTAGVHKLVRHEVWCCWEALEGGETHRDARSHQEFAQSIAEVVAIVSHQVVSAGVKLGG